MAVSFPHVPRFLHPFYIFLFFQDLISNKMKDPQEDPWQSRRNKEEKEQKDKERKDNHVKNRSEKAPFPRFLNTFQDTFLGIFVFLFHVKTFEKELPLKRRILNAVKIVKICREEIFGAKSKVYVMLW